MRRPMLRLLAIPTFAVATALVGGPATATDAATDPLQDCPFCGVWALAQEPTVARQDVPDGHEALVQNALTTLRFEMAFSPVGEACLQVERRGELAFEHTAWELASQLAGQWRIRNITALGEPTEMVIELNGPDQLLLRQPARMDEALVFVRLGMPTEAQAWCAARRDEVTP